MPPPSTILINGQAIDQIFYKGIPVVTYEHIAIVHQVPIRNIHKTFERHKAEFVEGEDYFRLDFAEANQLLLSVEANPNGLIVFTEGGYLLLVKPMRDKVSWQVQRVMRDAYFRDQHRQSLSPVESAILHLTEIIGVGYTKLNERVDNVDERIDSVEQNTRVRIDDEQRANDKRFKKIENSDSRQYAELENLKKTIESMATVAAGPHPGCMVNSVRGYVLNRLEMQGIAVTRRYEKVKCFLKIFIHSYVAHMREHYVCRNNCGEEIYNQDDLREAYDTPGFGTEENRDLAGDERLLAEYALWQHWEKNYDKKPKGPPHPFPRAVPSPRTYEPRADGA
jgi:hypothetical protein